MLDDFKTELKRLGMKRIQKEEMNRRSFALVLDEKDDDEEVEFADVLSPRRQNTANLSPSQSPSGRLREDSLSNTRPEKRGAPRFPAAKGGVKISQLPDLKSFSFGKKKDRAEEDALDVEQPKTQDDSKSDTSTDRVNHMRGSLGVLDFHTKPAGL